MMDAYAILHNWDQSPIATQQLKLYNSTFDRLVVMSWYMLIKQYTRGDDEFPGCHNVNTLQAISYYVR